MWRQRFGAMATTVPSRRERLRALLVALEHTPGVARSGYESSVYRGQITRDGFVDLRDYRAAQRAQGLLVIERSADGVEVVRVRRFELAGPTLEVHYETLLALDAAMARGLILQALIEGPSGDSFRGRFERVSYRDLQSGASLETLARR